MKISTSWRETNSVLRNDEESLRAVLVWESGKSCHSRRQKAVDDSDETPDTEDERRSLLETLFRSSRGSWNYYYDEMACAARVLKMIEGRFWLGSGLKGPRPRAGTSRYAQVSC